MPQKLHLERLAEFRFFASARDREEGRGLVAKIAPARCRAKSFQLHQRGKGENRTFLSL
jgi:hypothetical protein